MASYESLTAEQKQAIQDLANPVRSADSLVSRVMILGQAISASWNGGVSDLVNSLDDGEVIPNTSGLAGAQGVSKADLINSVGYLIDMSDPANNTPGGGYNTAFHLALRVKFSGINASIGG